MTAGRPTTFTVEKGEILCQRIADGENVLDICDEEGMPSWSTLCGWRIRNPEFAAAYARAREASAEALEAKAIREAAAARDKDSAAAARVRVDTLKWAAAKRNPRAYSDRVDVNHSGQIDTRTIPDDQLNKQIDELLGKREASRTIAGAGAAAITPQIIDLLPGDGATSAGFVSEAHGVLRRGKSASGETDAGG